MPSTLTDLTKYLADQMSTSWTAGENIFSGRLPNEPDTCIALIEILGFEPPAETFGASGDGFNMERPQIQVVSRAGKKDYEVARTNAETAYQKLRSKYGTLSTSSGVNYHLLRIRSSPYYQGEDENSRHIMSFTIDVWKDPHPA
jgi:hypothetical protein